MGQSDLAFRQDSMPPVEPVEIDDEVDPLEPVAEEPTV